MVAREAQDNRPCDCRREHNRPFGDRPPLLLLLLRARLRGCVVLMLLVIAAVRIARRGIGGRGGGGRGGGRAAEHLD